MLEARRSVIEKYNRREEVDYFSERVENGLARDETLLIRKAFRVEGRMLDIGTGAGREAVALARMGFEVVGLDIAEEMIKQALHNIRHYRKNGKDNDEGQVQLLICDLVSGISLKSDIFDGVLMLNQVIEHVPSRDARIFSFSEAYRTLKKGGSIIVTTHLRDQTFRGRIYWCALSIYKTLSKYISKESHPAFVFETGDSFTHSVGSEYSKGKCFIHIYSLNELVNDLRAAGFTIDLLVAEKCHNISNATLGELQSDSYPVIFCIASK